MCSSLIPCPLCTQPAFMNVDTFRTGLVSVATRHLSCPICSELLLGLDKLTIHMFAHLQGMRAEENHDNEIHSSNNDLKLSKKYSTENSLLSTSYNENKNNFHCKLKNKISDEQSIEINNFDIISAQLCHSNDIVNTQNLPNAMKKKLHIYYDDSLNKVNSSDKMQNQQDKNMYLSNMKSNNVKYVEPVNKEIVKSNFVICQNSSQKLIDNVNNKCNDENLNNQTKTSKNKLLIDFPCDLCGFKFNDEHILNLHFSLVHPTINDNNGLINVFPCHLCSKKFKMRGSLMIHLRVAHYGFSNMDNQERDLNSHNLTCSICNKIFTKAQHLATHIRTHENKQWECDVCTKMFTTKYFLKKHKRLHTGEMPYHCSQCNKAFTFQQSYHKHLQYHSTDKPHMCSECGRAFKELSTLHNHQRIHSGERPFACETCGKCFRQRVSYLVHQRIHTGAMPYQCTACGKNFRYKVSQRTHKCPIQPPGNVVRQSGNLLQKLLQNSSEQSLHDHSQKEIISNFNITDNIDNSMNTYIKTHDNNETNSTSSNDLIKQKINNTNNDSKEHENTTLIKNTDFFSMVLSPLNIPSPSEKMQNLSITSSEERNIGPSFEEYTNHNINHSENDLQTINEESLKQLLYGTENNII